MLIMVIKFILFSFFIFSQEIISQPDKWFTFNTENSSLPVNSVHAISIDNKDVKWIREPFSTESGHVAVMEAPDENVFVLVEK